MTSAASFSDNDHVYDCIGVGFGPSNLALAIAMEENELLDNVLFLESQERATWHPGMMLKGTDIQHNPLRDLVTPRNPQSPYGFLSYLKAKDRLFEFLNLDSPYPPRVEYAGYVEWVSDQFMHVVRTNTPVNEIDVIEHPSKGKLLNVRTDTDSWLAKTVSFGTGRSPLIPGVFAPHMGPRVVHLNNYLPSVARWKAEGLKRIAVIGGSQSAVEIILDLAGRSPQMDILSISRRFGFKHKDLSPFTERIYLPEFVEYFYNAPEDVQSGITKELWRSNYGAADHDVIATLNMMLYEQRVTGNAPVEVVFNQQIESVEQDSSGAFTLSLRDRRGGESQPQKVDAIVLATGFLNFGGDQEQEAFHPLLKSLSPQCAFREDGGISVTRDFRMEYKPELGEMPPVFLNGVCESTHGFGDAGSFSLLAPRSSLICESIQNEVSRARAT